MSRSVDVGVYPDIFKSDFPADDGAAAIVTQHIEAAAGTHTYNGILALSKLSQCLDSAVKIGHQSIHFVF